MSLGRKERLQLYSGIFVGLYRTRFARSVRQNALWATPFAWLARRSTAVLTVFSLRLTASIGPRSLVAPGGCLEFPVTARGLGWPGRLPGGCLHDRSGERFCHAWPSSRRNALRAFYQSEVNLLLERVHLGNLHLDLIADPDHAPGSAANQVIPLRLVDEEIIINGGERHRAAHSRARHIHEEPKVPEVSNKAG